MARCTDMLMLSCHANHYTSLSVAHSKWRLTQDRINRHVAMTGKAWWLIGRFFAFRPKGRRFKSRSSHHVGTLSKFLIHNALHYNCSLRRRGIAYPPDPPLIGPE